MHPNFQPAFTDSFREIDRIFASLFGSPASSNEQRSNPRRWLGEGASLETLEQGWRLAVELPGVAPEDVDVEVGENFVKIALRSAEKVPQGYRRLIDERGAPRATRSLRFQSPIDTEAATAKFDKGRLIVELPRRDQNRARRLELSAA